MIAQQELVSSQGSLRHPPTPPHPQAEAGLSGVAVRVAFLSAIGVCASPGDGGGRSDGESRKLLVVLTRRRGGALGQVDPAQSSCPPLGRIRGTALAPAGSGGRGEDSVPLPRF